MLGLSLTKPQSNIQFALSAELLRTDSSLHCLKFVQAVIPASRGRTQSVGLAEMANNLVEAVHGAIPMPASSLLKLLALQPAHATADAPSFTAQPHLLAHAPFAAMLAAEAFAVYCLTRLTLSLVRHPSTPNHSTCSADIRTLV